MFITVFGKSWRNCVSELKITVITFEEFSDYEFIPPATFYVMDSMQNYHFVHTSKRDVAQSWCDDFFGKGKYSVKASKIQKGKGDYTAVGTSTRRGQKR
jgi:hypothetical protein